MKSFFLLALLFWLSPARADLRQEVLALMDAASPVAVRQAATARGAALSGFDLNQLSFKGGTLCGETVEEWNFDLPVRGSASFVSVRFPFPEGKDERGEWRTDGFHRAIHDRLVAAFGPGEESSDGKHRDTLWNFPAKDTLDPPQMILTYAWLGNHRRIALTCLSPSHRGAVLPTPGGPFPDSTTVSGWGVNIHFGEERLADLDRLAEAGCRFIRSGCDWAWVEKTNGVYAVPPGSDRVFQEIAAHGMRLMYVLCYGNGLYEPDGQPPIHPESIAAFARWAGFTAKRYAGQRMLWEVWNEPNGRFWPPRPDADQYAELLLTTCKSIRQADPTATIVAPAALEFPWDYLFTVFDSGALAFVDGVSVHPYRSSPPESTTAEILRLRALIASCAPPGRKGLPILSAEWGYSTTADGMPRETQGDYATRMLLCNMLNNIPATIWYDWIDDGPDARDSEQNYGLLAYDGQWKPSFDAIRTLIRELSGYRLVSREAGKSTSDYLLRFQDAQGHRKLVGWTTDAPHDVTLTGGASGPLRLDLASRPRCWSDR